MLASQYFGWDQGDKLEKIDASGRRILLHVNEAPSMLSLLHT